MTIKEFNDKFKEKGGIRALAHMMSEFETRKHIAYHFGVTPERVSHWAKEFYGKRYDPRITRKQMRLDFMLVCAPMMTKEQFMEAFYYDANIDECLAQIEIRKISFLTKKQ